MSSLSPLIFVDGANGGSSSSGNPSNAPPGSDFCVDSNSAYSYSRDPYHRSGNATYGRIRSRLSLGSPGFGLEDACLALQEAMADYAYDEDVCIQLSSLSVIKSFLGDPQLRYDLKPRRPA